MLNNPASRRRRQEWLRKRAASAATSANATTQDDSAAQSNVGNKRKRAPNCPKEFIAEEKRQKEARRATKKSK
jgi:hypothetical protein